MPAAAPARMNASAGSPRARKARSISVRARGPATVPGVVSGSARRAPTLPGSQLGVFGDQAAVEVIDPHSGVEGDRFDPMAEQTEWHRVTHRRHPDRRQLVDLADDPADPWPQPGQQPNSSRSVTSRSAGTAQISECSTAFTSPHQATAAVFQAARSSVPSGERDVVWRSRRDVPRSLSIPDPRHDRSPV